ncbi:MAG: LCP family protein [Oscillospiraceae bacterium]|jgi:hypothetical protein|nr:LCP family protein [Oscillospiraceae bacterium]
MKNKKHIVSFDATPVKVRRSRRKLVLPDSVMDNLPKIIIISIIAVIVLIFLIIAGLMNVARDIMKNQNSSSSTVSSGEVAYGERDSLTVLIVKTDDTKTIAEHFILMRLDPAENAAYFTPFSPDTVIASSGQTMGERYSTAGAGGCAKDIEERFGSSKVYNSTINFASMIKLIDAVGGVKLTVEYDFNYKSKNNDRNIYCAKGSRSFSGGEAARLLDCPEWPGGVEEQRLMYARTFASIANDILVQSRSNIIDKYYNKISDAVTNNVGAGVFQDVLPALENMAFYRDKSLRDITKIVPVETTPAGDGKRAITESSMQVMHRVYGRRDV